MSWVLDWQCRILMLMWPWGPVLKSKLHRGRGVLRVAVVSKGLGILGRGKHSGRPRRILGPFLHRPRHYIYLHTNIYMYIHMHMHMACKYVCIRACVCICICAHIHTHVCIYIYIDTCTYIPAVINKYNYIYIYTHA